MQKTLNIKLLGETTITLENEPVSGLRSRTAEALLIYLACEQRPFSRQYLAEFFWEARDPEQSAANLRAALSMLRKQVGDHLHVTRQTVAFNSGAPYRLDVAEFLAAAEETKGEESETNAAAWETAVSTYGGVFLKGFSLRDSRGFEEWALLKREHLQQQALLLLRRLLRRQLSDGRSDAALTTADKLLRLNPLSEWAHHQKMILLARSGQRQAALVQYQTCCTLLQDELGVEPGPETAALAERLRRAGQVPRHNLPPPPTLFVGREQELDELNRQLTDPNCRLLTIIGPGGMGKTRLALAGARRLIPTGYFLNGIRFVPLADASTPAHIPSLIAAAAGVALKGDAPPGEQAAAALANEEMLLVLDNMEHLLEGSAGDETAAFLARLLAAAPLVTLLVTSRRRLYLREERLFDLTGLDVPAGVDRKAAMQCSAVQLFMQTAASVRRHFRPTSDDIAAMVDICRTLGGMPLGIELAAAWLRHMPCPAIAQTLHTGIDLLTTSLRNVPDRHRSLTAVFDHSWRLLTDGERQIFARLSLFRGGFTAEAAQAVAKAAPHDLNALVDHSLLRRENGRYTLHDLLRQYAAGRLAQDSDEAALRQAHAAFFLTFLAGQGSGEEIGQRRAIRAELPNIRAAWQWTAVHGDPDALLPAATTLHNFYSAESAFHEGIQLFSDTLGMTENEPGNTAKRDPLLRADLLGRKARMHIHVGQLDAARRALDEAILVMRQVEDPGRFATLLGYVAITAFYAGEFEQAITLAQESLQTAVAGGDGDGQAFAASFLGSCHKALGNYAAAADYFHRSVAVYEQMGDDLGRAMTLNNLGNLAQAQGDYAAAQAYYLTCSRLFQENNHLHGAATTLANAGRLARKLGDLTQAAALLEESLQMKREQQDGRGTAVALIGLADVSLAAGDGAAARVYLHEGLALARQTGDVKLALEGTAIAGAMANWVDQDLRWAARLLAFVFNHPALTQEVREQVALLQASFTLDVWEAASEWAGKQTVEGVIGSVIGAA